MLVDNINANNDGYMYLEKPIIGVVVIVVGTCCCYLCYCLLTRHNYIDFHLVVNSVVVFRGYPLTHA